MPRTNQIKGLCEGEPSHLTPFSKSLRVDSEVEGSSWSSVVVCSPLGRSSWSDEAASQFLPPLFLVKIQSLWSVLHLCVGLPWRLSGEESTCECRRCGFHPWVGKNPWRRKWQPIPGFLPGRPHGQRSLAGQGSKDCRGSHNWVCTHTHMHTFIQDKMWSSASSTHFTGELDRMQDLGPHPPPLKESLPSTQGPRLLLQSLRLEKPCTTPFHDPPFTYYKLFY